MRFISAVRTAVSVSVVSILAACGGGGGDGGENELPDTVAQPNSVIVLDEGQSALAKASYALVPDNAVAFGGPSGVQSIGNLMFVYTESLPFDTVLIYSSTDSRKYITGLFDNIAEKSYGCRSRSFTNAELQILANQLGDPVVVRLPVCNKAVAINQSGRQASYANLQLPADDGSRDSITLSANFTWPVPLTN